MIFKGANEFVADMLHCHIRVKTTITVQYILLKNRQIFCGFIIYFPRIILIYIKKNIKSIYKTKYAPQCVTTRQPPLPKYMQ